MNDSKCDDGSPLYPKIEDMYYCERIGMNQWSMINDFICKNCGKKFKMFVGHPIYSVGSTDQYCGVCVSIINEVNI